MEVIVLYRDCIDLTRQCLQSIRAQVDIDNIFITLVDQDSQDKSLNKEEELFDRLIVNTENEPVHKVWDRLIKSSNHRYCCLVNNDTILSNTCLARLQESMIEHTKALWVSACMQNGKSMWGQNCTYIPNPETINEYAEGLPKEYHRYNMTDSALILIDADKFSELDGYEGMDWNPHLCEFLMMYKSKPKGYYQGVEKSAIFWHVGHCTFVNNPEAEFSRGNWYQAHDKIRELFGECNMNIVEYV